MAVAIWSLVCVAGPDILDVMVAEGLRLPNARGIERARNAKTELLGRALRRDRERTPF